MKWPFKEEWSRFFDIPDFPDKATPRVQTGIIELRLKFDGATDASTQTRSVNGQRQEVICRIRSTNGPALLKELKAAVALLEKELKP